MNRILGLALVVCLGGLTIGGCGDGARRPQQIQASAGSALTEAKSVLENYARGQSLASEVEGFPNLIERVKAEDAAKGAILEKGLNDIRKSPASAGAKAKELLKQL